MASKIEWTDETWNPVTGCDKVSEGCANCYAERMAKRFAGRAGYPKDNPFAVTLHEDKLELPLRWRKPRRIFVCSMGDLFHEDVPFEFIDEVWMYLLETFRHTFIILTKRPQRMYDYFCYQSHETGEGCLLDKNVWLGVSVENQARADERIPILLDIPAAVRFVSIEPMLGPVDLTRIGNTDYYLNALTGEEHYNDGVGRSKRRGIRTPLDWVIVGGESGPGSRSMHPDWARSVRDQCIAARVPFFFKQWGEWKHGFSNIKPCVELGNIFLTRVGKNAAGRELDGREWNEWPEVK